MRILFLSTWFPYPPDNGARVRVYNLIRALAKRHEVHLISLLQDDSDPANAVALGAICNVVSLHESRWFRPGTIKSALGFFSSRPRSAVDTFDPQIARAVSEAIRDLSPDVVVASTLGAVEHVPRDLSIPTVYEGHNCEYAILKRSAERSAGTLRSLRRGLGWRKFARWEAGICSRYSAVVMVSEQDKALLRHVAPSLARVEVVPNGVDTEYYAASNWSPARGSLIYNGALTYGVNLDAVRWFASDIHPILGPDYRLKVTGRTIGVDLTGVSDCPGIDLVGYVDDMREALRTSAACVVPLRDGGGTRLKILEAMAAGVPVVSTSVGAEGIDVIPDVHLLIADTPADLAAAIRKVTEDHGLATALSRAARELVEQRYAWASLGEQFARIVESVV